MYGLLFWHRVALRGNVSTPASVQPGPPALRHRHDPPDGGGELPAKAREGASLGSGSGRSPSQLVSKHRREWQKFCERCAQKVEDACRSSVEVHVASSTVSVAYVHLFFLCSKNVYDAPYRTARHYVSSIPKVQEIPTPFPSRSGLHSAPNGLMCYSVYDNVMATNVSTGKVQTVFLRKVCTFRQQMLIDA